MRIYYIPQILCSDLDSGEIYKAIQNLAVPSLRGSRIGFYDEAWATAARQEQWHQHIGDQRAIEALRMGFEGKESPEDGAKKIASIYEPILQSQEKASHDPWDIICEALMALGDDRKIDMYVIELINAMHCLPDVVDQKGNPVRAGAYGHHAIYWRDLPFLRMSLYETAFGMFLQTLACTFSARANAYTKVSGIDADLETGDKPDEADYTDIQQANLMNVTTFGALYINFGKADICMIHHASDSLHDVLAPYRTSEEEQRRAATLIPPAATWILIAGENIYDFCNNRTDDEDSRRCYPMNPGRWILWKTKFAEIATIEALDQDVRAIAAKAAREMDRIS